MEAAVSSSMGAMGPVLRKLELLLAPESRLRKRVKDGIGLLKQDLDEVSCAFVDLSVLETPNPRAKCWMEEARELSYHVEDFVDELMLMRTDPSAKIRAVSRHRVGRVKIALLPAAPRRSTRIAKIAQLRDLLWQATERLERYQLDDCCSSPSHMNMITQHRRRRAPALYGDAANLVGIEDSRTKLIEMLTGEAEQQLKVVSIVGPAGVGKTTLAKEIFLQLKGQFELRAFVHASRKIDMRMLLGSILSQVQPRNQLPSVPGTVQSLIDTILEQLQDKRYLIVIDDLWEETAWDIVRGVFPEGNNCSRIVATTENMNAALKYCNMADNILKMKPLENEDSGYLFFNRVFGSEQQCPDELKEVSYGIIKNCCGLPLSLIHVAGLLASIDYSELWYYVHDHLCSIVNTSHTVEEIQKKILNLSYNSLPPCLKTCLLYFNMYPEGYIMWKVHLVKQWIAEGFINAAEGKDREEIAEGYFEELVNRGMVQPMKIDYNDKVLPCTVHHIIFDLINHNSKEEEFISAIDYSQPITGHSTKAHRLSFRFSSAKYARQPATITMSQLRSLAFFGFLKCMPPVVEFKHLRVLVLDFWGSHDGHKSLDFSRICILFQLRYLKISGDIMVELPAQMQGLHYLETLEIDARLSAVPLDIVHLPSLLHLGLRAAIKLPDGIGHIKSLSTLLYFDLSCNSEDNIRSLSKLTNLQHLHLTCSSDLSNDHLKRKLIPLVFSLGKLGNLKSLTLTPDVLRTAIFFDIWSSTSSPPMFLEKLELLPPICFFHRLPSQIGKLHKLCILKIVVKELKGNDISNISGLPSLVVFSLYVRTTLTGTIVFSTMAFPALKYFKFTCGVMCLDFQAGAMPNLQRLKLCFNAHRGENHSRMLDGIEHLLNLQEVAGRFGVLPGADESDWKDVKLLIEDTVRKHPRCPRFNSKLVDFIEEEYPPSDKFRLTRHEGSSSEQKNKEKACAEDIDKHIDSRLPGEFDLPLASRTSDHHKSGSSVQKSEASLITPSPTSGKDNLNHHQEKKQWTDMLGLRGGLFWHGVADRLIGKYMAAWKEGRISGTVVLVKKEALSQLGDFPASLLDGIHHNTGFDVQFQLVSATKADPRNGGKGTVGKPAYLKEAVVSLEYKGNGETAFRVNFEWDMSQGIPGAVLVRNLKRDEFFLKTLTLEGVPSKGTVVFVANSWIYPHNLYSQDRIFFTNDTYLPSKMPVALVPYRQDELKILRGDDNPGPYKEHDRVYRYGYYNDLGEPDKGEDRARPILGGSQEHPYPRRCRTGRHPTATDPNSESRLFLLNLNIYVPRDERVGRYKMSDFLGYSLKAVAEAAPLKKGFIGDTPKEFDSFEDILGLYELGPEAPNNPLIAEIRKNMPSEFLRSLLPNGSHGNPLKMPLPNIIKSDILKKAPEFKFGWRTDEEFARETLAGVNPVIIKRLTEFPAKSTLDPSLYGDHTSKITEAHIQHNLEGLPLQNALKNNRLFILDHHDHFMPYLNRINNLEGNFIYASRTLLFLKDDGTLKPLAIELSLPHPDGQQHGAVSKVYTPAHTGVEGHIWQLAKAYACVNDSAWHQLISHWMNTHAVIEPFVIATNRQLSVVHPVHKLLRPHYRGTLNINAVARQTLINADGIFERTMFPAKYTLEMSSDVYKSWNFNEQALPADLVTRGVAVPDKSSPYGVRLLIKDYPYAVDGLVIWWVIERWVKEYLDVYYSNDGELQRDVEVQAWWKEVREEAHGDLRDRDWWPRMDTVQQLARTCTTIIWVASALHAAVNFGQYAYAGYLPNRPTVSRRPMPEPGSDDYKKLEAGQEEADKVFIRTFTSQFQTIRGIMLIEILSKHSSDEVYLGQRDEPEHWTSDTRALDAFKRFRRRLVEIENRIKMMNDNPTFKNRTGPVGMPYTLLYPNTLDVTGKKGEGLTAMGIPNSISI